MHLSPLLKNIGFGTPSRARGCCSGTTLVLQTREKKNTKKPGSTRLCSCTPGIVPAAAFHAPAAFRWSSRARAASPHLRRLRARCCPRTWPSVTAAKHFSFQPAPGHRLSSKLCVGIAAGSRTGTERGKPPRIHPAWPCPAALSSALPAPRHRHRSARGTARKTEQEASESPTCSRPDEEEGEI